MVCVPGPAMAGLKAPVAALVMPGPAQVRVPPPAPPVTLAVRTMGVVVAVRQIGACGVMVMLTVGQA